MILLLLSLLSGTVGSIYLYIKFKFSYWANKNVPYIEPKIPFGNINGIGKKIHSSELMKNFYNDLKGKAPFGGIYFFINPVVLAIDLDFIKNVLVRDFSYFQNRGVYFNERDDPLSAHLFSLEGTKWKTLRSKLTITFTSAKMRFMFPTIADVASDFQKCLSDMIQDNEELELKDVLGRFTTDVIGTCAFGINCNSLKDPNAEFRVKGKKVFDIPRNRAIKQLFMATFKDLARSLRMKTIHDDVSQFFMKVVEETVKYREENNVKRNDFLDLLIELKNHGSLDGDKVGRLTLDEIAAQAFVFFLAGFETSSTTMSYCLYELSMHQDIQDKARSEINTILKKYDGNFTYEAMKEMTYINQIINESLRKYPPGANIIRSVSRDYAVPNTNYVLQKDTLVMIPVYAIHHDHEFYPNPEVFDPNRFKSDEIQKRHPQSFLAFGDGPRNCIGLRFGMMQARIGLVTLIRNFKFTSCSKSTIPLVFSKRNVVLSPEGGLWLSVKKLQRV